MKKETSKITTYVETRYTNDYATVTVGRELWFKIVASKDDPRAHHTSTVTPAVQF